MPPISQYLLVICLPIAWIVLVSDFVGSLGGKRKNRPVTLTVGRLEERDESSPLLVFRRKPPCASDSPVYVSSRCHCSYRLQMPCLRISEIKKDCKNHCARPLQHPPP